MLATGVAADGPHQAEPVRTNAGCAVPSTAAVFPGGTRRALYKTPPTATFARAGVVGLWAKVMQVLGKTGEENLEDFGCGGRKFDTFVRANVDVHEKCGGFTVRWA